MHSTGLILGIESSCDETAAAVVDTNMHVRSSVVATQHELHERFAGVVPEIASRAHLERILPVIRTALNTAEVEVDALSAIAVGHRPGLIGSLLVGVSAAKTMAWSLSKPLIGVDHVLSHLFACELNSVPIEFPAIGLVVSGGHTSLFHMNDAFDVEVIGRTIDDAVGEAYDKAATILQLGYPGGPLVDQLAQKGNDNAHDLPVSRLDKDQFDFSFSGLKTALLYAVRGTPKRVDGEMVYERSAKDLTDHEIADFAASFQRAACAAVIYKLKAVIEKFPATSLVVGGGVSANSRLRRQLQQLADDAGLTLRLPEVQYCVDNAAMIAGYAQRKFEHQLFDDLTLNAATTASL